MRCRSGSGVILATALGDRFSKINPRLSPRHVPIKQFWRLMFMLNSGIAGVYPGVQHKVERIDSRHGVSTLMPFGTEPRRVCLDSVQSVSKQARRGQGWFFLPAAGGPSEFRLNRAVRCAGFLCGAELEVQHCAAASPSVVRFVAGQARGPRRVVRTSPRSVRKCCEPSAQRQEERVEFAGTCRLGTNVIERRWTCRGEHLAGLGERNFECH